LEARESHPRASKRADLREADEPFKRLVGWKRVTLAPGESRDVTIAIDPPELQTFDESKNVWKLTNGDYGILVGPSSDNTFEGEPSDPLKLITRRSPFRD
jgi:Fibronectin type III-like domain